MKIWCIYSHHSYILSLSYHKFTHSRLSYPKQYKETWHATTSLSTPPSSQHHLAGIAVVSCLLFIHTTSLVIHITYFDNLTSVESTRVPYSHCHYKPYEPLIHGATASRRLCSELSSQPTASAAPIILMPAPLSQD